MINTKTILSCFLMFVCIQLSAMQADVVVKSYSDLNQSYIELYTYIINPLKHADSLSTKRFESLVVIRNDTNIVVAEKYLYSIGSSEKSDILDLKKYNLGDGDFSIRVEIIDLDDSSNYYAFSKQLKVSIPNSVFSISDPLIGFQSKDQIESLKKLNVPIEPMVFNFCRNQENLLIYSEFYNADQIKEELFVGYTITPVDTSFTNQKKKFSKITKEQFVPMISILPIGDLLSGAYVLKLEVFNRLKEVLETKEIKFDVSNADYDLEHELSYNKEYENSWVQSMSNDKLVYSIKAIFPQLSNSETDMYDFVLKNKDLSVKKYFLYKFWASRSPEFPEQLHNKYMSIATAVDNTYPNNFGHGFESDRGYIFLKYGKPNDIISVEDEPTAPPYEIWVYNHVQETNQTGVKFLFYNKTLVANDFVLLHSTCRGEMNNPRWEVVLYGNDPEVAKQNSVDARSTPVGFNRRAKEYFSDF